MKRSLVVLVLAAAVLAGCGGEPEMVGNPPLPESMRDAPDDGGLTGTEPAKAVTAAYDAALAAGGIRLRTRAAGSEVDVRYSPGRAADVVGSGSGRAEVRRVGDAVFVKATPAFWRRTAVAGSAARIGSSWMRVTRDDERAGGMLFGTDLEQYLGRLLDPGRWDRWGERKTVRGVAAVAVVDDQRPGTVLYVAATGKPYPLLLAARDDSSWEFLELGTPAKTGVPAGAIDGDRLPAG